MGDRKNIVLDLIVLFSLSNIVYSQSRPKLCLCILLTVLSFLSFSQPSNNWYLSKILNDNNGLPQNSVMSTYLDEGTGFLWLTTEAGLVRYDGINTRVFDLRDLTSLKSIRTARLFPTVTGNILGCNRQGEIFEIKKNYPVTVPEHQVKDISFNNFLSRKGNSRSVKEINFEGDTYRKFINDSKIVTNSLWLNDSTWLGTSDSVIKLFQKEKLVHQWPYKKTGTPVLIARHGFVYVLNSNSSGYCINLNKNTFVTVMPGSKVLTESNPVLFYDKLNDQPVILNNNNLYELEFNKNIISAKFFATLENPPTDITSIIFHKNKRFVFVSTNTTGVYIYRLSPFRIYRTAGNDILNNNYGSVLVDSNHLFTCRSLLFDLNTGNSRQIPLPGIDHSTNIGLDTLNNIWTSMEGNIISFPVSNPLKINKHPVAADNIIKTFFLSRNGTFWVSTRKFLAHVRNNEPTEYIPFDPVPDSSCFFYLTETPDNRLVGVSDRGVYLVDTILKKFIRVLSNHQISQARTVNTGTDSLWWITTYGNGTFLYNTSSQKLTKFPVDDRGYLLYSHAFIEDGNNNFLVPTNKGLFVLNKTNLLHISANSSTPLYYQYFDVSDGLLTNEFNGGCNPLFNRLPGGDIILPALQGLVRVKTSELAFPLSYPIFIDLIETKGHTYTGNPDIHFQQNERTQTWHLAIAQWNQPNSQGIFYRTDQDNSWQRLPAGDRKIQLNELTGGNHLLEIKYQYGLLQNEFSAVQYKFYIVKKYYETVWFWLAVILLIGIFIFLISRFRTTQLQRNNKRLQRIIQQNTKELSDKNTELEETLLDLNGALISLKENSIFKNRLIGLLGHDMLVPLRFIANISDHLYTDAAKLSPATAKESTGEIKNTAAELLYLGESLIQWIKLEEGTFRLILRNINIEELVNEIVMVHKPIAAVKNNRIIYNIPSHLSCTHDPVFIKVILHNLLLNANKFTSGGTIAIESIISDKCFTMHVKDTGSGMQPSVVASLNNLIPVASQKGTDKEPGWGMGYMLIIDLLRFANGKLNVESSLGAGTRVSFSLPLQSTVSKSPKGDLEAL